MISRSWIDSPRKNLAYAGEVAKTLQIPVLQTLQSVIQFSLGTKIMNDMLYFSG